MIADASHAAWCSPARPEVALNFKGGIAPHEGIPPLQSGHRSAGP